MILMAKRSYGTGQLYVKQGAWFGRWRTSDGRRLNRRLGPVREPGGANGLTRHEVERVFRKVREAEEATPRPVDRRPRHVDDAADSLRRKLAMEGLAQVLPRGLRVDAARAHRAGPRRRAARSGRSHRRRSPRRGDAEGRRAPKTVRNVITFLHSVFEHAIDEGWCAENPVRRARVHAASARATPSQTCSS